MNKLRWTAGTKPKNEYHKNKFNLAEALGQTPMPTYTEKARTCRYDERRAENPADIEALNAIARTLNTLARDGAENKQAIIVALLGAGLEIASKDVEWL